MNLPAAVYRIENLQRAWRWIRSNPDAGKIYFREHYAAYATAQDSLLSELSPGLGCASTPSRNLRTDIER